MNFAEERERILRPFYGWDEQIHFCEALEEWDKEARNTAIVAFEFLKDFLGDKFPVWALKKDHSIGDYFVNNVPWTKVWFTWLAESFQELRTGKNFDQVLRDFRSEEPKKFHDALTLLEYGLKFKKAGFYVDFEQPVRNRRGKEKRPDLQLTCMKSGQVFFCEISRLTIDPLTLLYESTVERIVHGGFKYQKYLCFSGSLHQRLKKADFEELTFEIDQMIQQVGLEGKMQELVKSGIIELAIAEHKDPSISIWAKERGYDINAWGLPQLNTFFRTQNKIWRKADQTSANYPSIIIIKQEDGSFRYASPQTWIHELEKTLFKCADVLAVIVTVQEFGNLDKVIHSFGENYFVQRTERYALGSRALVIFNRMYKNKKVDRKSVEQLFEEFL